MKNIMNSTIAASSYSITKTEKKKKRKYYLSKIRYIIKYNHKTGSLCNNHLFIRNLKFLNLSQFDIVGGSLSYSLKPVMR